MNKPIEYNDHRIGRVLEGETISGDVRLHTAFPSAVLRNRRDVAVYLPPSYKKSRTRHYPVLYLQDGQNMFDSRTAAFGVDWRLDEAAERLIAEDRIEEIIMVAIYNTPDRKAEYTPPFSDRPGFGLADAYGEFVINELKPFIDRTYRTRPEAHHTGIMGSSLGGLVSLYLSVGNPDVFGKAAAVSPSLWFGNEAMAHWLESGTHFRGPQRLWLCAGGRESRAAHSEVSEAFESLRRLRTALLRRGYLEGHSLFYLEVEDGEHNEASWAARADRILLALYPARYLRPLPRSG